MLADSAAMRTFLGAADAAAAKTDMFTDAVNLPADRENYTLAEWNALLPYVLIWTADEEGFIAELAGAPAMFDHGGEIWFQMKQFISTADLHDWEKYCRDFKNHVGDVLEDIEERVDNGLYLHVQRISVFGPYHVDFDEYETEPWIACDMRLEWD